MAFLSAPTSTSSTSARCGVLAAGVLPPQVIYTAIDNMFGGEGRITPRSSIKEYTATELRIVRRIMDGLLNEYEKAWKSVYELKFDFMRQETNFTFAKNHWPRRDGHACQVHD